MKVAITSTGESLESRLDQRFGRCAFFVIYDTETGGVEILPNPNKDAVEGAGPASVRLVASKDVKKIISGVNIKPLLDNLKIQMVAIREPERTVKSVIDMLKNNQ
jgi:predicted Fe-Mo cluster-binding NifX family protein